MTSRDTVLEKIMINLKLLVPLEGVGPENRDFFGPCNGNERSECQLGPHKSRKDMV
jgi:hypothetical protein